MCSASIAARATDLIKGINTYQVCWKRLKVVKTFPFLSSWLSPFSPWNTGIVPLSDGCTLPILICILNWCASHIKSIIACTPGWRRKGIFYQRFHISNIRVVLSFHCVCYGEVSSVRSIFLFHFVSLPSLEAPDKKAFQNGLELLLQAESGLQWKSKTTSTRFCKKKKHTLIFLIRPHICGSPFAPNTASLSHLLISGSYLSRFSINISGKHMSEYSRLQFKKLLWKFHKISTKMLF